MAKFPEWADQPASYQWLSNDRKSTGAVGLIDPIDPISCQNIDRSHSLVDIGSGFNHRHVFESVQIDVSCGAKEHKVTGASTAEGDHALPCSSY
jgi:hypothetical protein